MSRRNAKKQKLMSMNDVDRILTFYGVPKNILTDIRLALTQDAMTQSDALKYDRIYSGIALMLNEEFGFGQQRIVRGLKKFDDLCGSVIIEDENGNTVGDWRTIEERLKERTGIVIHTGVGNEKRLILEIGNQEVDE